MFARITPYQLKSRARDAAIETLDELKHDIMALAGMVQFINVIAEDGGGYVVSVVRSKKISDSNAERVQMLWGKRVMTESGVWAV
jgi:hypothetical protein